MGEACATRNRGHEFRMYPMTAILQHSDNRWEKQFIVQPPTSVTKQTGHIGNSLRCLSSVNYFPFRDN